MADFRIAFADEGADLFYGDRHLGTINTGDLVVEPGELTFPASLLADVSIQHEIRGILNDAEFEHALKELWAFLTTAAPGVEQFTIWYESEYDDEGGYFGVAHSDLSDEDFPDDATYPNDWDGWQDKLNELVQDDYFPAGEYRRP